MSEESISNYDWITGSLKTWVKKLSLVHANSDNILFGNNTYEKMLVSKSQKNMPICMLEIKSSAQIRPL